MNKLIIFLFLSCFFLWSRSQIPFSNIASDIFKHSLSFNASTKTISSINKDFSDDNLLGANLPRIADWQRTPVFVNLIHHARRFGTANKPWDKMALLGEDGWPIGDFGVVLMSAHRGVSNIEGTYKISFDGHAHISTIASPVTIKSNSYNPATNQTYAEVVLDKGADQFMLSFTKTGLGIKNLKVIRPGYNLNNPPIFTRSFLEHINRFGTLRFKDWVQIDNSPVVSWPNRSTRERNHIYTSELGVPWEHVISLSNLTNKNIWVNIPSGADNDYIYNLANLFRKNLNPDIKIYIEYSNEVWNGIYKQHKENFDMAENEIKYDTKSTLFYDGKKDRAVVGYRRIAKRGKEISDIFRKVYGASSMMHTIRPIFASHVENPYVSKLGLDFISKVYGPPSDFFYGLAVAPYFNLGKLQKDDSLTAEQVLNALEESIGRLTVSNKFEDNLALSRLYNLQFLAYEGGPDTFFSGSISSKKAANLHPRMETLCRKYLDIWYGSGGKLFMWFTAGAGNWDTQYGAWELTTDIEIKNTPKLRCLDHTISSFRTKVVR